MDMGLVGFRDIMGTDSIALRDGRGQKMLIRSPHGKRVAGLEDRTASTGRAPRKCRLDGTDYVFPREVLVRLIRSHSPLARPACPCSRNGHASGMEPWGPTSRNGFTIDLIR